jgi:invasion protein IalB
LFELITLITFFATVGAATKVSAQQMTSDASVFDGWTLRCQTVDVTDASQRPHPRKSCEVGATVTAATNDNKQAVVLVVGLGKQPSGQSDQMIVQTPLAVWLPDGVKLQDKDSRELLDLSYTVCQPGFCTASAKPSEGQTSALMGAGQTCLPCTGRSMDKASKCKSL